MAHPALKTSERYFHRTIGGAYIRDVVFAANDGMITTFAVVAGVAGAGLSPVVVVVMGFANMLADGISMALGNYLGMKSRIEYEQMSRSAEEEEIRTIPAREQEEVRLIGQKRGIPVPRLTEWVEIVTSDKRPWVDEMLVWELGILPEEAHAVKTALATFVSFVIAGFFPLIPYLFPLAASSFFASIAITAFALFTVGSLRTIVTRKNWLRSGIEMLLVGGLAATAAYIVGVLLGRLA